MTNSNEKGERNWYFAVAVVLLVAFLVIIFLAALGCHLYDVHRYVIATIVWMSCGVTTLYWIIAIINFVEYIRDH